MALLFPPSRGARGILVLGLVFSSLSLVTHHVAGLGQWSSEGAALPQGHSRIWGTWGGHIRDGIGTQHEEARAAARMHRTGPAKDHLVPDVNSAGTGKAWS